MWARLRLTLLLVVLTSLPAAAQGCPQCKDSTAATPPATQSAYRSAILFLTASASTIFLATLILLKRQR